MTSRAAKKMLKYRFVTPCGFNQFKRDDFLDRLGTKYYLLSCDIM